MELHDDILQVPKGQTVAIKLRSPALICLHGMSNTGKTFWAFDLIKYRNEVFSHKMEHVIFSYNTHQPIYDVMAKSVKNITFIKGVPSEQYLRTFREKVTADEHILLILDDQQASLDSEHMMKIATELNHHLNITTLLILHNIFGTGRYSRTILLQTSYFCSMKNLRDQQQLSVLSRQIFGVGASGVINKCFDMLSELSERPYLLTDLHPQGGLKGNQYRLRSFIWPGETMIAFKVKKP